MKRSSSGASLASLECPRGFVDYRIGTDYSSSENELESFCSTGGAHFSERVSELTSDTSTSDYYNVKSQRCFGERSVTNNYINNNNNSSNYNQLSEVEDRSTVPKILSSPPALNKSRSWNFGTLKRFCSPRSQCANLLDSVALTDGSPQPHCSKNVAKNCADPADTPLRSNNPEAKNHQRRRKMSQDLSEGKQHSHHHHHHRRHHLQQQQQQQHDSSGASSGASSRSSAHASGLVDGSLARASSPAELLYAPIRKRPRPTIQNAKRVRFNHHSLSSIKEISPVSGNGNHSPRFVDLDDDEVEDLELWPSLPRPPRVSSERVPLSQDSRFKSPARPLPKTNPYFGTPTQTPNGRRHRAMGVGGLVPEHQAPSRLRTFETMERPSSYYDASGSTGDYDASNRVSNLLNDSEHNPFGIHKAAVRKYGIRGELYLTVTLNGNLLTIYVDRGRNFLGGQTSPCNSYVRLLVKPDDGDKRTHCRTQLIPRADEPVFNQIFTIELLPEDFDKRKFLLVTVWNRDLRVRDRSQLLGCMAFTIKHLSNPEKQIDGWYFLLAPNHGLRKHLALNKVKMLTFYGSIDSGMQASSNDDKDSVDHWSGSNERQLPSSSREVGNREVENFDSTTRAGHHSYTTDSTSASESDLRKKHSHPLLYARRHLASGSASASTSTTTTTTGTGSSWLGGTFDSRQFAVPAPVNDSSSNRHLSRREKSTSSVRIPASSASQPSTPRGARRILGVLVSKKSPLRKISAVTPRRQKEEGGSSARRLLSTGRLAQMGEQNEQLHKLPITFYTPNDLDETSQPSSSTAACHTTRLHHPHQQHMQEHTCIRRASSFSGVEHSEQLLLNGGASTMHDRKVSAEAIENPSADSTADLKKKFSFTGSLGKKLSFLKRRGVGDFGSGMSTDVRPTRDDLLKWAISFDQLLKHRYGCQLFRVFLQREFSDENIDFWIACEEYKRTKDIKRLPGRAQEIYDEFVAVQSPKEVNLDSDTRTATKCQIACADMNTFDNAQYRIQHLMEKDSYPRFLKSELYTELLTSIRK